MNNRIILNIILAAVLIVGLVVVTSIFATKAPTDPADMDEVAPISNADIEVYIRENISELSPEKEQLGGTFYVTKIEAENGAGLVEYEDGHNAYTANFTYTNDEEQTITITSFDIQEGSN